MDVPGLQIGFAAGEVADQAAGFADEQAAGRTSHGERPISQKPS